jgi:hypothetical protein
MARVVLSKNFDPNRVEFASKINDMNDGGTVTSCKLSYKYPEETIGGTTFPEDSSRLILQSARMKSPFGMQSAEKFGNANKWSVSLSFRGEEKKKTIASFRTAYTDLDNRVIQEGIDRPDKVGGCHEFDDDDDEALRKKLIKKGYSSRIKKAKNTAETDYPDTLRIDIPWDKEKQAPRDYVQFYNEKNEKTSWEDAQARGSEVVCLFEVNQVWSSTINHTFGSTVKLIQMKIFKGASGKVDGFQIQNEVEEDDDDDEDSIDVDADEVDIEEGDDIEDENSD